MILGSSLIQSGLKVANLTWQPVEIGNIDSFGK